MCILEKEPDVAFHTSGRNSGVLHAGFYYTENSLKANSPEMETEPLLNIVKNTVSKLINAEGVVAANKRRITKY